MLKQTEAWRELHLWERRQTLAWLAWGIGGLLIPFVFLFAPSLAGVLLVPFFLAGLAGTLWAIKGKRSFVCPACGKLYFGNQPEPLRNKGFRGECAQCGTRRDTLIDDA